jgi:PAS domain S-box-containing protein
MLTEDSTVPLILLVEDEESHRTAIQRAFEAAPDQYRLESAGSLRQAREVLSRHHPAVALTDFCLPDGDGSELISVAKGCWPIILMSAKGNERIAVQSLKNGAQDYVVKSSDAFARMPDTIKHVLNVWELNLARKRAEEALQESEEKYRILSERMILAAKSASFGVWDWDIAADVILWDDTMYEIHGVPKDSPVPLAAWIDVVYPGELASALDSIKKNIYKGGREVEFQITRSDGEVRYIYSAEGFIRNDQREVIRIVGVNTDITKRKQAEENQRSYARRLVEMEEDLRKKLAIELHDEIARDLTVLGMNNSIIGNSLDDDARIKISERIEDSARLIQSISRRTRNIMAGLRPPVLDDYGLLSALRWHADLFSSRTGITVSVQADESFPRINTDVEISLFRIYQEALMNTSKHSMATSLTIRLALDQSRVLLVLVDDGIGFDIMSHSKSRSTGWGLTIMRERAELLGGLLSIESLPGTGTTITVEIPQGGV